VLPQCTCDVDKLVSNFMMIMCSKKYQNRPITEQVIAKTKRWLAVIFWGDRGGTQCIDNSTESYIGRGDPKFYLWQV